MANLFDITDQVAVVTGGGSGIGLGIAQGLAEAGARVAIIGRDHSKLAAAAEQLNRTAPKPVLVAAADVADEAQVTAAVAKVTSELGEINILFNNAGVTHRKAPQDFSLSEWRRVIDINLDGVFLMCRAVHPSMKRAGGGKIINTGSMASWFGASYASPYAASKGAVVQLTKSLALAWAADNIQVNAILPGWFKTELTDRARQEVPGLAERVTARIPSGRWATPGDMVGTAIWLASHASDYVTGAAIAVDGGYSSMM